MTFTLSNLLQAIYTELANLSNGLANNDRIIRETGIYQYQHILTERGIKEQVILASKPPISGGLFVIETEILDITGTLPPNGPLSNPYLTGDGILLHPGTAWDAAGEEIPVQAHVVNLPNPKKAAIYYGVPASWLDAAVYPVTIDPTYSEQPDAAAGKDNRMRDKPDSTVNHGTSSSLNIGDSGGGSIYRSLLQFDLTSIPAGAAVSSATLSLYLPSIAAVNNRTLRAYRIKRAWTESGSTWNKYDASNNWGTGGCGNTTSDREATDVGSRAYTTGEAIGVMKEWTMTASKIEEMIPGGVWTNNDWLLKADTESSDEYNHRSSDIGTASQRPKLEIVYTTNHQPNVIPGKLTLFDTAIGLYDTRVKLRAAARDTALTTKVRN